MDEMNQEVYDRLKELEAEVNYFSREFVRSMYEYTKRFLGIKQMIPVLRDEKIKAKAFVVVTLGLVNKIFDDILDKGLTDNEFIKTKEGIEEISKLKEKCDNELKKLSKKIGK